MGRARGEAVCGVVCMRGKRESGVSRFLRGKNGALGDGGRTKVIQRRPQCRSSTTGKSQRRHSLREMLHYMR